MTKQELIALLQAGKVQEFNKFRADNPDIKIDLLCANLQGADLLCADLDDVVLVGADLKCADLKGADLKGAVLHGVDFRGADLKGADLQSADLLGAIFDKEQIAMLPELLQIVVIEDKQ
jgi:uncharacterized protein YjbI with pentapeptide repeats